MKNYPKWYSWILFAGVAGFCALALEVYCRILIQAPSSNHVVDRRYSPYFRLTGAQRWSERTDLGMKPTVGERGKRPEKIAFVGDSVAYGVGLSEKVAYSERLQELQDHYDVYNFGVPGYGLPEIRSVLDQITAAEKFAHVFYIYNVNDVYDAMPVLLSLGQRRKDRFDSIYRYEASWVSHAKAFALDWVKSPFVLFYYFSSELTTWRMRQAEKAAASTRATATVAPAAAPAAPAAPMCYRPEESELVASQIYQRTFRTEARMYENPELRAHVAATVRAMREQVEARGAHFWVVPFYDMAFFLDAHRGLHERVVSIFTDAGIPTIDLYREFDAHRKDCNFYEPDFSHFLTAGHALFADWIEARLARLQSSSNASL